MLEISHKCIDVDLSGTTVLIWIKNVNEDEDDVVDDDDDDDDDDGHILPSPGRVSGS